MGKRIARILIIVLCVLLATVLLLFSGGWFYLDTKLNRVSRGDGIDYTQPIEDARVLGDDLIIDEKYLDVMHNGGDIEPPEGDVNIHKDIDNILLIGTDERDENFTRSRADSMMLLSINNRENTIRLVSLERAIGVSVPDHGDDWLTHVFAYGGPELLLQTIRSYFKIDVSRYVRVNFHVFETAITDIGGVEVDFSKAEVAFMNQIAREKKFHEGMNRLDGPTALVYARIRKLDSDWNRVQRQREVIQAAIDQAMTLSLAKIDLLADKLLPMIDTNLTNSELTNLLIKVPILAGVQAQQMTLPVDDTHWGLTLDNGRKVVACDFEKNAEIVDLFLTGEIDSPDEVMLEDEENQDENDSSSSKGGSSSSKGSSSSSKGGSSSSKGGNSSSKGGNSSSKGGSSSSRTE